MAFVCGVVTHLAVSATLARMATGGRPQAMVMEATTENYTLATLLSIVFYSLMALTV